MRTSLSHSPPLAQLDNADDQSSRADFTVLVHLALKNAKVSAELHLYPTGGAGYGLRPTKENVTT